MSETTLKNVLDQLPELSRDELVEVRRAVDTHLTPAEMEERERAFEQTLLNAGLLTEIKPRRTTRPSRELIQVEGRPVSETLIEERR